MLMLAAAPPVKRKLHIVAVRHELFDFLADLIIALITNTVIAAADDVYDESNRVTHVRERHRLQMAGDKFLRIAHVCSRHLHRRVTHTPHVTRTTYNRRMSHVTRHTSHVTRHTSHVTRHTSHVTRHLLFQIRACDYDSTRLDCRDDLKCACVRARCTGWASFTSCHSLRACSGSWKNWKTL